MSIIGVMVLMGTFAVGHFLRQAQDSRFAVENSPTEIRVQGHSLEPYVRNGESRRFLAYSGEALSRGQLVIFDQLINGSQMRVVKRVAALEGDRLSVINGKIFVEEEPLRNTRGEVFLATDPTLQNYFELFPKVPEGQIFVIGDQVGRRSIDSRVFGFVARKRVRYAEAR